jgi:hypothetical protein
MFGYKCHNHVYILPITLYVLVYTYVVLFSLHFTIYQRRCYILTIYICIYITFLGHVLFGDGHKNNRNM